MMIEKQTSFAKIFRNFMLDTLDAQFEFKQLDERHRLMEIKTFDNY